MRQRVLFLDDSEARHSAFQKRMHDHDVAAAYTTVEAIAMLDARPAFDVVYLDHDLGEIAGDPPYAELTGRIVAEYIANGLPPDKRPQQIVIHSWNIDGGKRMRDILQNAGLSAILAPF